MKLSIQPAILVGLVVALGMAQPSQARDRNAERALLGIAGVAVLAHILNNRDRKRAPKAVTPARRADLPARVRPPRIDYSRCMRQRWTDKGWQTYVANRCVTRLQRKHGVIPGHGRGGHGRPRYRY